MRNILDKICRVSHNKKFQVRIFFRENRAVYETKWENMIQSDRPQMKI